MNAAWCVRCDWRVEGPDSDRLAEKHVKLEKHATVAAHVAAPGSTQQ